MSVATLNVVPAHPVEAGLFALSRQAQGTTGTPKKARSQNRNKPEKDSDARLVKLTLEGDKQAFDMLVIKY